MNEDRQLKIVNLVEELGGSRKAGAYLGSNVEKVRAAAVELERMARELIASIDGPDVNATLTAVRRVSDNAGYSNGFASATAELFAASGAVASALQVL